MNSVADPVLRVIALGQFAAAIPPLNQYLAALNVEPVRCVGIGQLPAALTPGDILLTDMVWLNTLTPENRAALQARAAGSGGWIALSDGKDRFKDQVAWQRLGVGHFFGKPLDPERLAALVEDSHDRLAGPPVRAILLDDDQASLNTHGEMLRKAGVDVLETSDPLLVLEIIEEHRPDVLVVDIEMPGCRGTELLTILRQRPAYASLPAIYLTAYSDTGRQLLARASVAEDFLLKPVAAELLVASVKTQAWRYRSQLRAIKHHKERESHARLRIDYLRHALNEHAIVTIADPQGNIIYANQKFSELSGYSNAEVLGQNHRIVNSGTHPKTFFAQLWQTITAGKIWHGEICNRRKDGALYWVGSTIVPRLDSRGQPVEYLSIRTDITALKLGQDAMRQAREAAERANQAKSDFLSSMSHELRTPMNAILGFSQVLEHDQGLNADQHDSVHEILKASQHLLELINEVLDLAKIESGRIDLSMERIDLGLLAKECQPIIHTQAAQHRITLALALPPSASVFADRVRLKQVLINLLSNAVKYNREDGNIQLAAATTASGRLRISVTDTGPGIPADKLDILFQPFNRLGAEKTKIEGTGIGLTICRQLVERMGGTIGVESTPGTGSTFWVELAVTDNPTAVAT